MGSLLSECCYFRGVGGSVFTGESLLSRGRNFAGVNRSRQKNFFNLSVAVRCLRFLKLFYSYYSLILRRSRSFVAFVTRSLESV